MQNLFESEVADLYLIFNRESNHKYFGYKPLNKGVVPEKYITSSENRQLHIDWAKGLCDKYLIKKSAPIDYVEKLEAFAIDYLMNSTPNLSYNLKNNGHKGDPKIHIMDSDREDIIKCVDNNTIPWKVRSEDELRKLVKSILQKEADREYEVVMVPIDEVMSYQSHQVKGVDLDRAQITRTIEKMEQYPKEARDAMKPVSVVIRHTPAGIVKMILNGHHTRECVKGARGWEECPVIFHEESEFGSNEAERESVYRLFGLQANPRDFVESKSTTKEDCVRDLVQEIKARDIDLSTVEGQAEALDIALKRYGGPDMLGTDAMARGVYTTVLNRFEMNQATESVGTVRTYGDRELNVIAAKLRKENTSVVVSHFGNAAHAHALGYILRNMKNEGKNKGIIVFHARGPEDIVKEANGDNGGWINDTRQTIKHLGLNVEIQVLSYDSYESPRVI